MFLRINKNFGNTTPCFFRHFCKYHSINTICQQHDVSYNHIWVFSWDGSFGKIGLSCFVTQFLQCCVLFHSCYILFHQINSTILLKWAAQNDLNWNCIVKLLTHLIAYIGCDANKNFQIGNEQKYKLRPINKHQTYSSLYATVELFHTKHFKSKHMPLY